MVHQSTGDFETGEMCQTHEAILEKTAMFIAAFYSHLEKNGEMVPLDALPEDWPSVPRMAFLVQTRRRRLIRILNSSGKKGIFTTAGLTTIPTIVRVTHPRCCTTKKVNLFKAQAPVPFHPTLQQTVWDQARSGSDTVDRSHRREHIYESTRYRCSMALLVFSITCTASHSEPKFSTGQHPYYLDVSVPKRIQGGYLLYLPKDYGEKEILRPTILFLHGAGERGDDLGYWGELPCRWFWKNVTTFFIVFPRSVQRQTWSNEFLITLLRDIVARYRVDPDRIYLSVSACGGNGTWNPAMEYPDTFAAIAPVCGWGNSNLVSRIKDIPYGYFMVNWIQACRSPAGKRLLMRLLKSGNVKTTIYPDAAMIAGMRHITIRYSMNGFYSIKRAIAGNEYPAD